MNLQTSSLEEIIKKFQDIRKTSENLCSPLKIEDYVVQAAIDVSPPKWNLGHTTWFFETFILQKYLPDYKVYHPRYSFLFNSYYDNVGERVQRINRGLVTRPTVEEVYEYRAYVDEKMLLFFEKYPQVAEEITEVIELGLNHEQQHQELFLTDLKFNLYQNPLFPAYIEKEIPQNTASILMQFLNVPAGFYTIGYKGKDFHFDNEKGVHQVYLHDFKIANRLVSNAEYMEFMNAGGYQDFNFWYSEAWAWIQENKVDAPLYWEKVDGKWQHFTLHGLQPIDPHAPVTHMSLFEADAYARWKGKRLATEFEWEVAAQKFEPEVQGSSHFMDNEFYHPIQNIPNQFLGNTWEWTNSAYLPYPFFKKAEGAIGEYNGKFMINQMVLRGGSCTTPRNHIRHTYRNFFHPHLRWQFTGIRLAEYVE